MNKKVKTSTICPICGRPIHKASKYCIFHASAEEKTEKEFKEALKEYVDKIKKEDGEYDFNKFIFIGSIIFKEDLNIDVFKNVFFSGTTFEGIVFFSGTTFEGKADFYRTTFKGDTYFISATFEEQADFISATFEEKADFTGATFEKNTNFTFAAFNGNTYFTFATFKRNVNYEEAIFKISTEFKGATFEGNVNFEATIFEGHTTYFSNAIFECDANFLFVTFKGNAKLEDVTIKGNANFMETTFEGDSDFRLKYLGKNLDFSKIKTFSGKKLFIRLNNEGGKIFFERAYLENIYLEIELVEGISIDFTDALLRYTSMQKKQIENHILQEKKNEYLKANKIFLLLKNNFHSIGQYEGESWAFGKEKEMERKNSFHPRTLHKWLGSCFLNGIYGYGEKPTRVFLSSVLIILIFACVFMNCGIASPPLDNLPKYNILKELSVGILYGGVLDRYKTMPREQVKKSLYFSTVTFTTLGLGDFRPVDNKGRFFVGLEAFMGAFMMALFVYTFARRTGGR